MSYEPGRCQFCGEPVDVERDYQRIEAWRRKRHGTNSANYVRLIEPRDQWACRFCVERESKGIAAGQRSLL